MTQMPDYNRYSLEMLQDVLSRIEKDKYPEKVKAIEEQIINKMNQVEIKTNYSAFGNEYLSYKSDAFAITMIVILSVIGFLNLISVLLVPQIATILTLITLLSTLILIIISHPRLIIAVKIISAIFIFIGFISIVELLLELFSYILKTAEEYEFGVNLFGTARSFLLLGIGVYYFFNIDKNVNIRKVA